MGRRSIFIVPMTSAERSMRNVWRHRQMLSDIRSVLTNSANMHLATGRLLSVGGMRLEAHDTFKMAEMSAKAADMMNNFLAPYEDNLDEPPPFRTRAIKLPDPYDTAPEGEPSADEKQVAYEAERAARRPQIEALYGHLAKAEKAETTFADVVAIDPHSAVADMVERVAESVTEDVTE